jgi:nucleoside-diphosphate-sugar epimerase
MNLVLSNKLILVSGASGLLGTSIIKLLLVEGAKVRALVRNPSKTKHLQHPNIEIKVIDFADPATLRNTVQGCQIVFHFAGVLNDFKPYSYYHQVNVIGTKVLAELAIAAGVERFIHTSTAWVYGLQTAGQIDETAPRIKSGNFYSDSKIEGEEIIHQLIKYNNLPAVIVLPSQAYGPEDSSWTLRPLELIRSGRMILINGGQGLIQPIYIDDLAAGILLAAKAGKVGQSYILCGQKNMSIREYFGSLANLTGKKRLPSIPEWLANILARSAEYWAGLSNSKPVFTRQEIQATMTRANYSGDKARKELGFIPTTDLATGMAKIKKWLESDNS